MGIESRYRLILRAGNTIEYQECEVSGGREDGKKGLRGDRAVGQLQSPEVLPVKD